MMPLSLHQAECSSCWKKNALCKRVALGMGSFLWQAAKVYFQSLFLLPQVLNQIPKKPKFMNPEIRQAAKTVRDSFDLVRRGGKAPLMQVLHQALFRHF
jgi:hypothetical protein